MSEILYNPQRIEPLITFTQDLIDGGNGKSLIEKYKSFLSDVTPYETMIVLDSLLQDESSFGKIKDNTGKIINVFFKSLSSNNWQKPPEGHFLYYLMLENREVEKVISVVRPAIRTFLGDDETKKADALSTLRLFVRSIKEYELHYIKKENILFPFIEKSFPEYRCLKLMWSFHDDFRRYLKELELELSEDNPVKERVNSLLGKLFFIIIPVIFREEQIIYPVAFRAITDKIWDEMLLQSIETGWCYGISPDTGRPSMEADSVSSLADLGTGTLNPEQIMMMLNKLPVDITFVDENDEVRYFSSPAERIFPRSKAIIGRKVQNCHPPESVHVVMSIINAFRNGTKNEADFRIRMKDKYVLIKYFALRDSKGTYRGTLEVSQEISGIQQLTGDKRLLDW